MEEDNPVQSPDLGVTAIGGRKYRGFNPDLHFYG